MTKSNTIQSVVKAMDVLRVVGHSDNGVRLNEIATSLDMKMPATHHMVRTLLDGNFLAKRGGLFYLGEDLTELAINANGDGGFTNAVGKEMHHIYNKLPRCVVVMVLISNYTVEMKLRIGYERPNVLEKVSGMTYNIYANAGGLISLAYASEEIREHLEEKQPFAEMGLHLWTSRDKLEQFLAKVRSQGYVVSPFDSEVSFRAAAPVFDVDGNYRSGLGISIASSQLENEQAKHDAIDVLLKSANKLKEQQG